MSHTRRPVAVAIAIGLAAISLLLAGRAWSQATYDHFSYLPLVARQHPPTPTPAGWIGFYALHGRVKFNTAPTVPLANAVVSYTRFSYVFPQSAGITLTDSSGAYAFTPINIHDTDNVNVYAQAQGFARMSRQARVVIKRWKLIIRDYSA